MGPVRVKLTIALCSALGSLVLAGCVAPDGGAGRERDPTGTEQAAAAPDAPAPPAASDPGTVSPPADFNATSPPTSQPCPQSTVLVDNRTLTNSTPTTLTFALPASCRLSFDLHIARLAGSLNITVDGPTGRIVDIQYTGVDGPAGVGLDQQQQVEEGRLLPPGDFTYRASASGVAEFSFAISAGP